MSIDTAAVSSSMSATRPSASPSGPPPEREELSLKVSAKSPWRTNVRRLFRQRSAITGMIILGIVFFAAVFAPLIAPYPPNQVLIGTEGHEDVRKREAPCVHAFGCPEDQPQHIMGLDGNVRDVYSRVLYGARISLFVGFVVVFVAMTTGMLLGALGGFAGGWVDNLIMRSMDVLLAFPSLLLAIAIAFVLSPGLLNAMLAISIVTIPAYARVVRSTVLSAREMDYVDASRSVGASNARILSRQIMPNVLSPLIVLGTLGIGTVIIDAAALSFLGLGAQPPTPEWGAMLGQEFNQLFSAPHLVIFPGFAIMLTVLAFNLLGDGLRDVLDPRLRT